VLDEPTNDLDIETLELLEDLLNQFQGTVILVSHDRVFLDNVVTSTLVFEGRGLIREYVGGVQDWIRQSQSQQLNAGSTSVSKTTTSSAVARPTEPDSSAFHGAQQQQSKETIKRKLSYKEQQELARLPSLIEELESEKQEIETQMSGATFYKQDKDTIAAQRQRFNDLVLTLERTYHRWEELEQ
jgi:ATP-binding cassette subfamily F protein uup